jgi:hypothetical protein
MNKNEWEVRLRSILSVAQVRCIRLPVELDSGKSDLGSIKIPAKVYV